MSRLMLPRRKLLLATPMLVLPHRRAEARIPGLLGFGGRPVSGGGYTGPVDAVSGATVAYSLRAVSAAAAAAAGPCIDIWRASDSTISTIHLLTNGNLDVATAVTFCTSTTGYIAKWYDQTGTGDHLVNATHSAGTLPQIVFNVIGGTLPVLQSTAGQTLSNAGSYALQGGTACGVGNRSSATNRFDFLGSSDGLVIGWDTSGPSMLISNNGGGPLYTAASNATFHAMQAVMNFNSSVLYVDGTSNTGGVGNSTGNGNLLCPSFSSGGTVAQLTEMIWYNTTTFTSGQAASMRTNVQGYWGTP